MFWSRTDRWRIFFATDLHGSDQCFRKWLNAASVYSVNVLLLGGDVTGKLMIPVVQTENGDYRAELGGEPMWARGTDALAKLLKHLRFTGAYPIVVSAEELAILDRDQNLQATTFRNAIRDRLAEWMKLADERLQDLRVKAIASLGNDDEPDLCEIVKQSRMVEYGEDTIIELATGHEVLSFGFSAPTPWHTPRELDETRLTGALTALVKQLKRPDRSIFNVHCPPKETLLDLAPRLDNELRPQAGAAGVETQHVGSIAVRQAIETIEPMLSLHGHVHESPGSQRLGRTLAINPGSEYSVGILRGAIVTVDNRTGITGWQIVQG